MSNKTLRKRLKLLIVRRSLNGLRTGASGSSRSFWSRLNTVRNKQKARCGIRFSRAAGTIYELGPLVRNTAIAIGITFVTAVGVYLAIRFLQSVL